MSALKKGSFRLVHRNVWEMFPKLGRDAHREALVYLYLETGPHSNYTGLFQAPLIDVAKYTCMTKAEVIQAIDSLSRRGLIVYDQDRQMVFVNGMLQRQLGTSTPNEDNTKGVVFHVERMPEESPSVEAFISANREIPEIDYLFEMMYGGDDPGGVPGGITEGTTPTRDFELKTLNLELETSNDKRESVIPMKTLGTTPRVPPSSTPESTSTPGKSKSKTKASGKNEPNNSNGSTFKEAKLAEVARLVRGREIDLAGASEKLRAFGFTSSEINSPALLQLLQQAAST